MTPKKKAKELFNKYDKAVLSFHKTPIKKCALIAVDEILASKPNEVYKVYFTWMPASTYWIEVKEQIKKL